MIDDDDVAPGFTNALSLGDHANRIGDDGNDMESHDVVECVVGEFQIERVHLENLEMRPAVVPNLALGARQHVRG